MLSTFLSTAFANGLTPGGVGFDRTFDTGHIAVGAVNPRGGFWAEFESSVTGRYLEKNISSDVVVLTFDLFTANFPSAAGPILRIRTTAGQNPSLQLSIKTTGKLVVGIANAGGNIATSTDSAALTVNTLYTICVLLRSDGTTWRAKFTIYDSSGVVVGTPPAEITASTSLSQTFMQLLNLGPLNPSMSLPLKLGNVVMSADASAYPAAPALGNDTHVFQPVLSQTWVDVPAMIKGGALFGQNAQYGKATNLQALAAAVGPTKANRDIYITHAPYSDVAPPDNLGGEAMMIDGTALGYPVWPVISCLGFNQNTTGWPAGGLADFTSGSMDSVMDGWAALFNTLPETPVLVRVWREFLTNATIYGPNGAAIGGVNETSTTYVAAFRYMSNYIRSRCPWVRIVWCPSSRNAAALSTTTPYYPGDDYVDWVGIDSYVGSSALQIAANSAPLYGGFNSLTGTESRKPMLMCETQTDRADATRVADIQNYTSAAESMPGALVWCFWDAAQGAQYEVVDQGDGFVAAYQAVISDDPFLGVTPRVQEWPASDHQAVDGSVGTLEVYEVVGAEEVTA